MGIRKRSNIWRTVIGCMSLMLLQLNSAFVNADGLETLGPPSVSIASGTGIVVSGVGLAESQPGSISIDIPLTATVKQVLLYWEGYQAIPPGGLGVTNTDITVNGAPVTGVLIGGPLSFENNLADSAAYRADITGMGLVSPGANSLSIGGMNFTKTNHGAGVLVIIDDSLANPAEIDLRDGNDFAFGLFLTEVQMTTVPQTFTFTSSPDPRTANLELMFASVFGTASSGGADIFRPTAIEVSVDGGPPTVIDNLLDSIDGQEWDSISIDVPVPAGATSVTVEAQSVDNGAGIPDGTTRGDVASFHWISAGLSVTPPPPPPPVSTPGRMTGGGKIKDNRVWVKAALTLHCDITLSNNLQINWKEGNKKYRWHLRKPITSATCIDDPAVEPPPPAAPFDTFIGEGIGKLNGKGGSIVRFTFVDGGEPGRDVDSATITIWAPGDDPDVDAPVLEVSGSLKKGDYQAHYDQPHK